MSDESKCKEVLERIANGRPLDALLAEAALGKPRRRPLKFLGDNLAAIASLVVAISGVAFGMTQACESKALRKEREAQEIRAEKQKERELKLQRAEAFNKLIPYLTSENAETRRFATGILTTLQADLSPEEIESLVGSGAPNAEMLEAIGNARGDVRYKKAAAELYAARAERNRREMAKADDAKDEEKATKLFNDARADADRALSLDAHNARAIYQRAVLYEREGRSDRSFEMFSDVIKFIDGGSYPRDNNLYLRAHVKRLEIIYNRASGAVTSADCEAFRETKRKYSEASLQADWENEILGNETLAKFRESCEQ